MPRLFIALSLPIATRSALAQLVPLGVRGVRVTDPSQLHLTLMVLSEVEPVVIDLAIAGVGRFRSRDGEQVLWAGLQPCPALMNLHHRLGAALRSHQFSVETRPFAPHITLARCRRGVPTELIETFLQSQRTLSLPPISVRSFELYSSHLANGGHTYHCEQSFVAQS
jgi:RNA 2',3'-cyclic 3'-phosphodiesterase